MSRGAERERDVSPPLFISGACGRRERRSPPVSRRFALLYRPYGKTGLKVSALGFGAMRLPMTEDEKAVDRELALPMFLSLIHI